MVIYGTFSSKLIFEDFWNIFLKTVTENQLQTKGQIEQSNDLFINCISKSLNKNLVHALIYLQSFTKYLRQIIVFMWNSALRENFNFCFSEDFYCYWLNFHFGKRTEQ